MFFFEFLSFFYSQKAIQTISVSPFLFSYSMLFIAFACLCLLMYK